ncbi:menaquinone-dependent protoporphyrinogen IX dehydrogenase [Endozoicomonas atrinae]|uniref:menaquinone-dependent protoporphyrinogen IX dehydrogenase n=1 Tax=Endozoicomonas atrinae TaxID=1333660 RepID=UPI0008246080|nr:menaquinone-dependent protoporphyrinogen IX dehydrogenase [Endozoicomonas atrinae]
MSRIALLYQGCEGQTRKITERIGYCLTQAGHETFLCSIAELKDSFSLNSYDGVVLGCSIRYGKHHREYYQFIEKYSDQLATIPSYFFSVNLTARKPERRDPHNNRYLQKFLKQIPWTPDRVEVFAGALLYTQYRWVDKQMIRLIMKLTGGPTDVTQNTEFTDWKRVKAFAEQLNQDFQKISHPMATYERVVAESSVASVS